MTEGKTPKSSRARTRVLRLPATLGIARMAELHPQLDQALEKGGPLALDGSAVEQLDGAALQLLLAFQLAAVQAGRAPDWRKPSPQLREAAALLGLDGELGLSPDSM
ncbi:MAG TPA: STAS domain-containing protein [Gammaproteobacteria bacterium]|nr:STAS domain-containing protein [Gammaproteobacteria bacterium]